MAFDPHANFALTTVAVAPSPASSGTSLTLTSGAGAAEFPDPGPTGYPVTIWPVGELPLASNAEIARVTGKSGLTLTIVRAQEGTSARAILAGDQIAVTITAEVISSIENAIPSIVGLLSAVNISGGTTSNNLSALTFSNSNGVSFGLAGSVLTATVATDYQSSGAYLTTAMRSDAVTLSNAKISAGTLSALRSDLTFSNSNGVSFGLNTNGVLTATVATNYQSQGAYLTTAMQSDAVTLSNIKVSAGGSSALLSAVTFSNSNGLAFGLNAGTITGSYTVPTVTAGSDTAGVSNLGNTAGTSGVISGDSIRLLFAGGNNITLSQSINGSSATITISGANAGGAQTGISGIVVSDATYTSGTISFSNAGNITIASSVNGATQFIRLSGNAAQTNQSAIKGFGVSNTGQTAGNTGISTGIDWVLAGSQSITLSQSTAGGGPNTVWVQHPAWLTTAMQSNAATISNINVSGGTTSSNLSAFKLIDSNGVSWSVDTGSKVYATVKTDYLTSQSTDFNAITLGGNTAGTTTFHATNNRSIFLNGGNNVTLSGNGSTITIAAAAQTTQSAIKAIGVSNTGNTAGNTGVSTGIDLVVAGSNNITISQSTTAGGPNTIWVSGPTVGGAQTGISGLAAVGGTVTSGTASFSNANGVSFGVNGQTITASVETAYQSQGAYLTTAALSTQTLGFSLSGNIATTNSSRISNGAYALAGGNNVTIQQSNNTVSIAVGNYITTARASTDAIGLNTAKTNVTWTVNSSGLSLDAGGYAGTATAITGGSITVNSAGVSLNLPAYLTTADLSANSSKYVQEWALTGNTAGTTSSAQGTRLYFSGGNSLTISGNSNSLVFSVGNYITTARASTDAIGLNTAKTNVTWTVNSSGLSIDAGGYAGTGTSATNASVTLNSNGLAISVAAPGAAAENNWFALTGNTAGNTTASGSTVALSGGNGVTLSGTNNSVIGFSVATYDTVGTATTVKAVASANSVGTVTRWAAEDHAHAGVGAIGISTGNTAGTSGSVQGTYWIAGTNHLTVSQITSNNGSHTLQLFVPALATLSYWANKDHFIDDGSTTLSAGVSALQVIPFVLPQHVSGLFLRVPVTMSYVSTEVSGTTANTTWTVNRGYTNAIAIMTQMTGANSLSLGYSTSTSATWNFQNVIGAGAQGSRYTVTQNVSYPVTGSSSNYTTSYAQSSANVQISSASMTLFTGPRFLDIPFGMSLTPGNYWAAFGVSTSSGTTGGGNAAAGGASAGFSTIGLSHSNLTFGFPGAVTANSNLLMPGLGSWSTNAAVMSTSSIQLASISAQASHPMMYFQIQRTA